jgi:hypothetical protein
MTFFVSAAKNLLISQVEELKAPSRHIRTPDIWPTSGANKSIA